MDDVYNQCSNVLRTFPKPTFRVAQNMLEAFGTTSQKLEIIANFDNTTSILPERAVLLLYNFRLLNKLKDTPEKIIIEFDKALPKIAAGLRKIVSSLQCSIGKLTDYINDGIKCVERSLKHLLDEFLKSNGVEIVITDKKSNFEPVIKCLQKLANTIASIAEAILNDSSLATNDVLESMTILTLILAHCFVFVQGTKSTMGTVIHSRKKFIPKALNECLHSVDPLLVGFIDSIRLVTDVSAKTVRVLLKSVVNLITLLDATLKEVFGFVKGVTLTVEKITKHLSYGVSNLAQGLTNILG